MLKHSNNVTIRESMQNDVCKITTKLQEMKEKKEAQLNSMDRLASMITMIEEEMVQLRKKYEKAVQRRNERYQSPMARAERPGSPSRWSHFLYSWEGAVCSSRKQDRLSEGGKQKGGLGEFEDQSL